MPRFSAEVTAQIVFTYDSIDAASSSDAMSTVCALARAALAEDSALLNLHLTDIHIHRLAESATADAEIQRLHGEINRLHDEVTARERERDG